MIKLPALDVVTCGELLIDFVATEVGVTLAQASLFQKAPGGAPANVAVGLARLGHHVGFLGQVGDDEFGHFLADTLANNVVDVGGLRFSSQARTALAFVSLLAQGERDFMFYRHPSADMLWRPEEVDRAYVARTRIFHYGSISLIHEPSRRQGNRTPYTDPEARGMIWGLTLKHDTVHIYRAIMEGICYGTELIFRTLRKYGFQPQQIVACGGPLKSRLWMQIHADVSNLPITFTKVPDAAVLGSAILASVGAGLYPNIQEAARHMVHSSHRIEPDQKRHQEYQFYVEKYIATYYQMRDLMHELVRYVAGGEV